MNTTLPTEPGFYLFCGFRDGEKVELRDSLRGPEVVRVTLNAQGKLIYVGSDFFYRPESAIGAWLPISEEAATLHELAMETVTVHLLRTQFAKAFTSEWHPERTTRDRVVYNLCGPFRAPDVVMAAEALFDRAVRDGMIVPDDTKGYAGWWKLAPTV